MYTDLLAQEMLLLTPKNIYTKCQLITLRTSKAAAQCIVIAPVCVFVCLWVRFTTASAQCLRRL